MTKDDNYWMTAALKLAKEAAIKQEVPVGAVAVCDGEIVGTGFNSSIRNNDPTAHAEMLALRQAAFKLQNYRLLAVTLYVTLEPCAMCVGAMLHARIKRLVFGASDPKTGAVGGNVNLLSCRWNHNFECQSGVLSKQCGDLLTHFFKERR